ncbi:unnamed protein product, partial [Mesorhabditis belari]|uniref:NADH dehydrogenase [ubiquinone] 1 subunit C2 n=1 Tax=Mesorhabditis belari TaxID=2138241 RepID=A0AAF3E8J5_9BILA
MTECTRVSDKEIERRESYIRAGDRPRELLDPFTWEYRWKSGTLFTAMGFASIYAYNTWYRKPWYFGIFPRLALVGAIGALAYGAGAMREHHNKTRDAVIEHYMQLHPDDFDHFKDRSGRAWSEVLLPWYPKRAQYYKFD